jgi:hypothetical protein
VIIVNTARLRRDLVTVNPATEQVGRLALLVAHRGDLIEVWVRGVNRLRRLMLGICPALERALTFTSTATLILLEQYQTPEQIRAAGRDGIIADLRRRRAQRAAKVADLGLAAAEQQSVALPARKLRSAGPRPAGPVERPRRTSLNGVSSGWWLSSAGQACPVRGSRPGQGSPEATA